MAKEHEPQRRNAAATAERIRQCAQRVFHEKGYDAATTREIAECAGVNIALIARYFGSKLGLFEQAVLPHLSLERFSDIPSSQLAETLAAEYAHTRPKIEFDPLVVLLRSASSPEAGPLIKKAIEDQVLEPLTDSVEGSNAKARATLIATQIAGLILLLRVLRYEPGNKKEQDALRATLTEVFGSLVEER